VLAFKEWLKANRTMPIAKLMPTVALKLKGHYAYDGVSDHSKGIARFYHECKKLLVKWLDRRGRRGRRRMSWEGFQKLLERFSLPFPRIMVNLLASM
jgi:hypothetical protein